MKKNTTFTAILVVYALALHGQKSGTDEMFPSAAIHGRIMYDYEFLSQNFRDPADDYKLSGAEFRRVRLDASGKLYKHLAYKVDFDFAGSLIKYRNVYLRWKKLPLIGGDLTMGSFGVVSSLEMATSSKYIALMERDMLTRFQDSRYAPGFGYKNYDLLNERAGIFLAYTQNGTSSESAFFNDALKGRKTFTARLTGLVFRDKTRHALVHLGTSYQYAKRTADPAPFKLKFRPGYHLGYKIKAKVPADLKYQKTTGLEVAAIWGPFFSQAEYKAAHFYTKDGDYSATGQYITAGVVFNGRRSFKNGAFKRIKMKSNFDPGEGTWGALELVVRYSVLNYAAFIDGPATGKTHALAAGINWYLNDHTRLMYNLIRAVPGDDDHIEADALNGHLLRVQVDF